jgi:cytochrome oxidase Cu insertion factor (SCO1/SenC/PrrC family)
VIPQLRDWHAKYQAKGLTIVGVHSPEFAWEKPYDKVVAATKELRVAYPVVQDNDFVIWKRYANRYWPAAVIVDKKGVIRYTHVGEGAYAEMERLIQRLLAEP